VLESQKNRRKKIAILSIIFCFSGVAIFCRVAYLQIFCFEVLSEKSIKNFSRKETVSPRRGRILDCVGQELAANQEIYRLVWSGKGRRKLSAQACASLSLIENLLERKFDLNEIKKNERRQKKLTIATDVSFDEVCKISEQTSVCDQLEIVSSFKRIYPHKNLASHILGYLGRENFAELPAGRSGLESILQNGLIGKNGSMEHVVNARGERLKLVSVMHPEAGNDVKLTLDMELQTFAEKVFEPGGSGAFVLFDPENGALRAVASFPSFDPNKFLEGISFSEWNKDFSAGSPLLNRAFNATYPPASIFKLVTFATALELGVVDKTTTVDCKGFYEFGRRKYYCIRSWGHGKLTARRAFELSCNAFCYDIGIRVGIDNMAQFAHAFGLGEKTGLLMPEKAGLVPSSAWKQGAKGEQWWKGEDLSASIGQSFLLTTPLQLARMLGSIFTGYLVRPRILEEEAIETEALEISKETLLFLQEAMGGVVTHGTAHLLGKIENSRVYAKTGTAQISNVRRGIKSYSQSEHAWCTAYFKVKGERPLVAVVLVEHAGRSRPAVVVVEKLIKFLAAGRTSIA
jgi:penicillin-binding protein 2